MNRIDNPGGLPIDPRIGRTQPSGKPQGPSRGPEKAGSSSFREIFQKEIGRGKDLHFSAHATDRLDSQDIELSPDLVKRLTEAVDRAADKGARDALLLLPGASRGEDLALVVSVTNRTVITAMDGDRIRQNVFTNIDSAVIVQ